MVTVARLARDCWQSFGPTQVPLGDCAAVRVGGIEVVLITKRTQALGLELFTNLGIDHGHDASSSSSRPTTSWPPSDPSPSA
jgi:microcystin degradation protein MlrC